MEKNIIVEISDGIILAVYCPDETYIVNVLDHTDMETSTDNSYLAYCEDLEEQIKFLKNCY